MMYVGNAFSLQMLGADIDMGTVNFVEVDKATFDELKADAVSCVGHADTAAILGVSCQRINVTLNMGDELLVAQLQGGRLPEGSTTLPEGFSFKYYHLQLFKYQEVESL